MKRGFFAVFFATLFVQPCLAEVQAKTPYAYELNTGLTASYRVDELDWNIAGNNSGTNPNIVSELDWNDLKIYQLSSSITLDVNLPWILTQFELIGGYGKIIDGDVRDSDYAGDNRTIETSRSINNADKGHVVNISLSVGPHFKLMENRISFIPLIGYSYHEQNMALSDGLQILPLPMHISGLNSTYETEWRGFLSGFKMNFQFSEKISFQSRVEYHWTNYYAVGDWNLRTDLFHPQSFEHSANGQGWTAGADIDYLLNEHLSVGFSGAYLNWDTGAGLDRAYYVNGAVVETRLNKVNWRSISSGVTLILSF